MKVPLCRCPIKGSHELEGVQAWIAHAAEETAREVYHNFVTITAVGDFSFGLEWGTGLAYLARIRCTIGEEARMTGAGQFQLSIQRTGALPTFIWTTTLYFTYRHSITGANNFVPSWLYTSFIQPRLPKVQPLRTPVLIVVTFRRLSIPQAIEYQCWRINSCTGLTARNAHMRKSRSSAIQPRQ